MKKAAFVLALCLSAMASESAQNAEPAQQSPAAKFQETQALAERGDAEAHVNLGAMYRDGQGAARDFAQAAAWLRKAADQGNASARYNLGLSYREGQGVAQNDAQVSSWYRKAADQGLATAQEALGKLESRDQAAPK